MALVQVVGGEHTRPALRDERGQPKERHHDADRADVDVWPFAAPRAHDGIDLIPR